jgi:fatty acid desaturase
VIKADMNGIISRLKEKVKRADRRLVIGMCCYAALIAAGLYLLLPARNADEWFLLLVFLLVFALLIIKTMVHASDDRDDNE